MTKYIFKQLKKLADNPNHFSKCLDYWAEDPVNNEKEAIRRMLSPYFLNNKLINTSIEKDPHPDGSNPTLFRFQVKNDPLRYAIIGFIDNNDEVHLAILQSTNTQFN